MSAAEREMRETGGVVVLPPSVAPQDSVNPSMARWIWNPYYPINNMGHIGLARQFGAGPRHRYTKFERCTFYPIKNIEWNETDREALAERAHVGLSGGPVPDLVHVKYAYEQVQELEESFGDKGICVFQPGIISDPSWVDDGNLVMQVNEVLQPRVYKLHEMTIELGPRAVLNRLTGFALHDDDRALVIQMAAIMRRGAGLALMEAERQHRALIQGMGDAAVGKPGKATPDEFDEWICDQLGLPVPETVHTGKRRGASSGLERAVELLAEKALRDEEKADQTGIEARLAALEAERAAVPEVPTPSPKATDKIK